MSQRRILFFIHLGGFRFSFLDWLGHRNVLFRFCVSFPGVRFVSLSLLVFKHLACVSESSCVLREAALFFPCCCCRRNRRRP